MADVIGYQTHHPGLGIESRVNTPSHEGARRQRRRLVRGWKDHVGKWGERPCGEKQDGFRVVIGEVQDASVPID
jgi:hypothetical protein